MSKCAKIWIAVASALVFLGLITSVVGMALTDWDLSLLNTSKYETVTHEISDVFENISIDTDTANIVFLPSDDDICKIICYQNEKAKYSVNVTQNTLTVKENDERKWHDHIGITFGSPKITVYLPKTEYGSLTVKESTGAINIPKDFTFKSIDITLSTGDIKSFASVTEHIKIKGSTGRVALESIKAKALDISVSTGNVSVKDSKLSEDVKIRVSTGRTELSNVSCKDLISNGDTGDITLNSVIASDKIFIERSTGDVKLNRCDASALDIGTDTGDVSGHLLSGKIFMAESDTGDVKVPMPSGENICKITSDTGDIKFTIE